MFIQGTMSIPDSRVRHRKFWSDTIDPYVTYCVNIILAFACPFKFLEVVISGSFSERYAFKYFCTGVIV